MGIRKLEPTTRQINHRYRLLRNLSITALLIGASLVCYASCERKVPEELEEKVFAAKPDGKPTPQNLPVKQTPPAKKTIKSSATVTRMGPKAPAIFIIAGLAGYTEPCGCTLDITLGGIDRLAGYIDKASPLYTDTLFLDAGDLLFEFDSYKKSDIPQEKARVNLVVAAMKQLHLKATVPGHNDFALGTQFYTSTIAQIGATPLAANLTIHGKKLTPYTTYTVGGATTTVIGMVDPKLYQGIKDVSTSDPKAALQKVMTAIKKTKSINTPIVLLVQGDLAFTKSLLEAYPDVDFGVVGVRPRMTDQVDQVFKIDKNNNKLPGGVTLEAYDQGRYLGILSLINLPKPTTGNLVLQNARLASSSEIEKYKKRIKHIDDSISQIPPSKSGEPQPMVLNLMQQKKDLEAKVASLTLDAVKVPENTPAFIWNTIPLDKGLPEDPTIAAKKAAYNDSLQAISKSIDRPVPPIEPGKPYYVGTNQCAKCHVSEFKFWQTTAHSHALKSLEDKGKAWDQSCIGCHVVGYEKPGGSVLGKLQYSAKIVFGSPSAKPVEMEKDLRNVGCEDCHGPGSEHIMNPVDANGNPQNITRSPHRIAKDGSQTLVCQQCHVPHHSPRFNFDNYVRQITGPGHPMKEQ